MLAKAGTATFLATVAQFVVLANAGATTLLAPSVLLVVLALFSDSPLDWMRRRGVRCCRSCWGCQIHGDEL